LLAIGIGVILTIGGCSESDDTLVLPDNTLPPCGGYAPGKVVVIFDQDATIVEADIVVTSFDFPYTYLLQGEAVVRAEVAAVDLMDVRDRLLASPIVASVTPTYRGGRTFLITIFSVGVSLDLARALIDSYSELTITRSDRHPIYVVFDVPVGEEDDWVIRFLEEDLVAESMRDSYACPTQLP
jgi:hypothetical protein